MDKASMHKLVREVPPGERLPLLRQIRRVDERGWVNLYVTRTIMEDGDTHFRLWGYNAEREGQVMEEFFRDQGVLPAWLPESLLLVPNDLDAI